MNPWSSVLQSIRDELERLAQTSGGVEILPDRVEVILPEARFGRWSPVLSRVVEELGQALVSWADRGGRRWYRGGPLHMDVRIDGERLRVTCRHRLRNEESAEEELPRTRRETAGPEAAGWETRPKGTR